MGRAVSGTQHCPSPLGSPVACTRNSRGSGQWPERWSISESQLGALLPVAETTQHLQNVAYLVPTYQVDQGGK